MIKFLIIVGLIFYLIYRLLGFFFKTIFMTAQQRTQQNNHQQGNHKRRASGGDLNIDYVPNENKSRDDFKGGDYVDFEELK